SDAQEAAHVGVYHFVPFRIVCEGEESGSSNPGIQHESVECADLVEQRADRRAYILALGEIEADKHGLGPTTRGDGPRHNPGRLFPASVVQPHAVARRAQQHRGCGPNAATRTRNEDLLHTRSGVCGPSERLVYAIYHAGHEGGKRPLHMRAGTWPIRAQMRLPYV